MTDSILTLDTRAAARTSSARSVARILTCLDRRLAGIELVGWPALEASLRAELDEAMAIAKARGLNVAPARPKPPKAGETPVPRPFSCGICTLVVPRAGSRRVLHNGVRKQVCPKCARGCP